MDGDLVINFLSVTGCEDPEIATGILESNGWDIERSINCYFAMNDATTNKSSGKSSSSPPTASSGFDDEDDIRAPLPQRMETLVDHVPIKHQRPSKVFEVFRDFEKERGLNEKRTEKQISLADLFKPPLDILAFGTFSEIKKMAEQKKQFCLVNIQDVAEFDCQKLNRDTWSNKDLKELISENFVFWQVNNENSEGKWFTQTYPVHSFPYIAIIDPRTGQKLQDMFGFVDAEEMAQYLVNFLSTNTFSGQIEPPPVSSKKQKKYNTEDEELELAIAASLKQDQEKLRNGSSSPPHQNDIQMNNTKTNNNNNNNTTTTTTSTATQNNNKENDLEKNESNNEDDEEFEDEEDEIEEDNYDDNYYYEAPVAKIKSEEEIKKAEIKQLIEKVQETSKIGTEGDCTIQIRCPNENLKGQFQSTDQIKNIYYYVKVKTGISNFKLLTSFPKVELTGDIMNKTLKEMDLAPRASIMCQLLD